MGLFAVAAFVGRSVLRIFRDHESQQPARTEYVKPTATIEGLESPLKVGESRQFHIAVKGVACNDLRVSGEGAGISLRKAEGACQFEVSASKPGQGRLRVSGVGLMLVDSFVVTVVK